MPVRLVIARTGRRLGFSFICDCKADAIWNFSFGRLELFNAIVMEFTIQTQFLFASRHTTVIVRNVHGCKDTPVWAPRDRVPEDWSRGSFGVAVYDKRSADFSPASVRGLYGTPWGTREARIDIAASRRNVNSNCQILKLPASWISSRNLSLDTV